MMVKDISIPLLIQIFKSTAFFACFKIILLKMKTVFCLNHKVQGHSIPYSPPPKTKSAIVSIKKNMKKNQNLKIFHKYRLNVFVCIIFQKQKSIEGRKQNMEAPFQF